MQLLYQRMGVKSDTVEKLPSSSAVVLGNVKWGVRCRSNSIISRMLRACTRYPWQDLLCCQASWGFVVKRLGGLISKASRVGHVQLFKFFNLLNINSTPRYVEYKRWKCWKQLACDEVTPHRWTLFRLRYILQSCSCKIILFHVLTLICILYFANNTSLCLALLHLMSLSLDSHLNIAQIIISTPSTSVSQAVNSLVIWHRCTGGSSGGDPGGSPPRSRHADWQYWVCS